MVVFVRSLAATPAPLRAQKPDVPFEDKKPNPSLENKKK
jgi:hypothetical protein